MNARKEWNDANCTSLWNFNAENRKNTIGVFVTVSWMDAIERFVNLTQYLYVYCTYVDEKEWRQFVCSLLLSFSSERGREREKEKRVDQQINWWLKNAVKYCLYDVHSMIDRWSSMSAQFFGNFVSIKNKYAHPKIN